MAKATCPVTQELAVKIQSTADFDEYDCPSCGVFRISSTAIALSEDNPEVLREALETAISQARPGEVPMIDNVSG